MSTPTDEDVTWPLAGEPAATPGKFTDADLGGVDVTHEYVDDEGNLRLPLGDVAHTLWATLYAYAHGFLGLKPPGWVRENVNSYWVWCMLTHYGKAAWKLAYVPWLNRIPGFKSGRAGIKAGDICAIAGYSHVGFYVVGHGSTFDLISGNSTSGSSDDAITVKRYPVTIISGHVSMTWEAAPTPAPTPTPASADNSGFVVGCQ
jgi:hypothetical protein